MNRLRRSVCGAVCVGAIWSLVLLAEPSAATAPDSVGVEPPSGTGLATRPRVLALERLVLPDELENPEPIRLKFEALLAEQLRTAKFDVIPSDHYEPLRAAVTDSLGGYFDPDTGEVDSTRFEAVARAVREAARERLGADATVRSRIALMLLEFAGGPKVKWHGSEDNIGSSGYGTVSAYSILVQVVGTDGSDVHAGIGGLQLARKFKKKSLLSADLVLKPVDRKDLFVKEEKNVHAIRMALTPFAANERAKR